MITKHKPSHQLEIQPKKPVLLSGPVLKLIPALSFACGGSDIHAITLDQLRYQSKSMSIDNELVMATRISFTRMQRTLKFVGRRRLIQVLHDLCEWGAIEVERTNRVNVYVQRLESESILNLTMTANSLSDAYMRKYIVIPSLAETIGLKAAIVLQQIHLRHYDSDGSLYVIHSLEQWHSQTFPFWGEATVRRIFRKLKDLNLIFIKPYKRDDDGYVNSYRVNYIGIAEILELPIPEVENPYTQKPNDPWDKNFEEWKNPVTLQVQAKTK